MELLQDPIICVDRIIDCFSAERNQTFHITNVNAHLRAMYVWSNPRPGAQNDEFVVVYSGNIQLLDREIAVMILTSNQGAPYLITYDSFRLFMRERL